MGEPKSFDAVVVGAGFAGMYMLHRLRNAGLSVQVIEAGSDVGGTWYWNRYPGARCDVESMEYSYQFSEELQQEWEWSERYSTQPEILKYANHVADRFDLRPDILFETRVSSAHFNETTKRWLVKTADGDAFDAQFCIMATGCLSSTNLPDFEGLGSFSGDWYHTGLWPKEGVDFTGKSVGFIGTGSSAIQSIPKIAEQARQLTVFQRTPNYSIPAHNHPLDPAFVDDIKQNYAQFQADNKLQSSGFGSRIEHFEGSVSDASDQERRERFERMWRIGGFAFLGAYEDLLANEEGNVFAAEFVREKIRETVTDAATAELLSPEQVLGCKRLCVDTDYFATYNRDNVALVSVKDNPVERITETGLVTGGKVYEFDCLVFATGFDAITGSLSKIDIVGKKGLSLVEKWHAGPQNYLGLSVSGFPNLFTITGPGSPSVLTNMIPSIEQHVNWIADCILNLQEKGLETIEAKLEAETNWVAHVNEIAGETLFPSCNSWYLGANIPGKPRVFMPYIAGFQVYCEVCRDVVDKGYEGFVLG